MHKRHHGLGVRLFGIKVGIDQACLGMAFIIQRRGPPFEVVLCTDPVHGEERKTSLLGMALSSRRFRVLPRGVTLGSRYHDTCVKLPEGDTTQWL